MFLNFYTYKGLCGIVPRWYITPELFSGTEAMALIISLFNWLTFQNMVATLKLAYPVFLTVFVRTEKSFCPVLGNCSKQFLSFSVFGWDLSLSKWLVAIKGAERHLWKLISKGHWPDLSYPVKLCRCLVFWEIPRACLIWTGEGFMQWNCGRHFHQRWSRKKYWLCVFFTEQPKGKSIAHSLGDWFNNHCLNHFSVWADSDFLFPYKEPCPLAVLQLS